MDTRLSGKCLVLSSSMDTRLSGKCLVLLLGRTGLSLLLHHFLILRSLPLLRIRFLHWARLRLNGACWQIVPLALNLHLVILVFFIVRLSIHAGKEVDAVGTNQVDRTFTLNESELCVTGDEYVNVGLEVRGSPHCQNRHFHLLRSVIKLFK